MPQATALIDGNNFYASCEQSLDPALIGHPVVVLSNNDGCIVARSAEARVLGIRMGTPYFKARRELERHNVVVRSSNYALYADMSQRMMSLLEAHCEELEVYSIDHQKITVVDAGFRHGLTADMQEKGAGGMPDQLFIEIDPDVHVVIRGRGETSGDAFTGQGQGESVAPWLQGQQWIALPVIHTAVVDSTNEL